MKHKLKKSKAPKGRYFNPEIFTDTEFCLAEKQQRTGWFTLRAVHLGVMSNADAYGRFEWDEKFLYVQIARGGDMLWRRFRRLLHLLALGDSRGRAWLCRYNEQGEFDPAGCYGHVRTWAKWQHVHEREGWRIRVKCPCGEVGNTNESEVVQSRVDRKKNAFSETYSSSQVTQYIDGKVYMVDRKSVV